MDVILGAGERAINGYFTEDWLAFRPLNQSPYANFGYFL